GTSPRACEICGSPWERVVERDGMTSREWQKIRGDGTKGFDKKMGKQGKSIAGGRPPDPVYKTVGWQPTCTCQNSGKGRCIVLDPFAGSGTTNLVAQTLGRDSIYIDRSKKYLNMALKRLGLQERKLKRMVDTVQFQIFGVKEGDEL
ncbi:MAG TPA: site-specific DNA-methyltransferase, partial [Firmicutes bacterium]|nr:site-specific DNA-methyltransferase [Bacillota bacterium]